MRCGSARRAWLHRQSQCALADPRRGHRPRTDCKTGILDGTEIRVQRPAAGRKDRDKFISGKSKQNAVKTMVVTDDNGRVLFLQPDQARRLCGHHPRPLVLQRSLL